MRAREVSPRCKRGRILTRPPQYPPSPTAREVGMSIFQDAILRFGRTIMSYAGDAVFLQAAVSAAANVIVADGDVAEEEIESAIAGIRANPILEKSYDTLRVEQELYEAIARAKTRAGRLENLRLGRRHRGTADRPAPGRLPDRRRRGRFRRHQRSRAHGARRDRRRAPRGQRRLCCAEGGDPSRRADENPSPRLPSGFTHRGPQDTLETPRLSLPPLRAGEIAFGSGVFRRSANWIL